MKCTIGNSAKIDKDILALCSDNVAQICDTKENRHITESSKRDIQNVLRADSRKPIYRVPIISKKNKKQKTKPLSVKIWSKSEILQYEEQILNKGHNTMEASNIFDNYPKFINKSECTFFVIRYLTKNTKFGLSVRQIIDIFSQNNKNISYGSAFIVMAALEKSKLKEYIRITKVAGVKHIKWIGYKNEYTLCVDTIRAIKKMLFDERIRKSIDIKKSADTITNNIKEKLVEPVKPVKIISKKKRTAYFRTF